LDQPFAHALVLRNFCDAKFFVTECDAVVERDMARRANGKRQPLCAREWLACAHGCAERSVRMCLEIAVVKLARDPEKWEPVFGKDHAQNKVTA
jgi:hypothetical protein